MYHSFLCMCLGFHGLLNLVTFFCRALVPPSMKRSRQHLGFQLLVATGPEARTGFDAPEIEHFVKKKQKKQ